jgi:hypothetical protein
MVLMILLVVAGFLFQNYYAEKVKSMALGEINKHLSVEIGVGEIDFTLLENFPNAALRFKDVVSKQKGENQSKDPLVKAKSVSILFNMWDIVLGKYDISKIQLVDAFLTVIDYGDGKNNYQLVKPGDPGSNENTVINIEKVILKNVHILYVNYPSEQEYLLQVTYSEINGQFNRDNYSLKIEGDVFSEHIKSGKTAFLEEKDIKLALLLNVNKKEHLYEIKKGKLAVSGLPLTVEGIVKGKQKSRTIQLTVNCEKTNLDLILQEIPAQYLKPLKDLDLSGKIGFSASLNGKFSGNNLPLINLGFSLERGKIKLPVSGMDLKDVALKGKFSNGKQGSAKSFSISVSSFKAKLKTGDISGKLSIRNFLKPDISVEAKTALDLEELNSYFKFRKIKVNSGRIDLNIAFQKKLDRFDKFTVQDFISSRTRGEMKLHNADFSIVDSRIDYHGFEGDFSFSNKDLIVHEFSGNLSSGNFSLKGRFKNVIPWIFMPGEKIEIVAGFTSEKINLDELLLGSSTKTDTVFDLTFNNKVRFDLDFKVGHFSFRKFRANNVKGDLEFGQKKLKISETSFESMDGSSVLNGLIDGTEPGKFFLKCNADFQNVDIHKLFYQLGNFGQNNITSDNLSGIVTANVYFEANMNPQLRISPESVYTNADIQIKNGELRNYAPIYRLAKFIKMEELRNIRFSILKNHIEIKDEFVYIPEMEINSSTLDLHLQASHSFDNRIDYHFSLYLSELINRKKKEEENPDYIIQEDESGKPRIHISMTGTASEPIIKYDMKAVRKNISSSMKKERENLKEVFRKEFSAKKEEGNKDRYFEKSDTAQHDFIIEWDKEDTDSLEHLKPEKKKTQEKKLPEKKDKDFIISFDEEDEPTPKGAGN